MKKKLLGLMLIAVSLLSCIGITYAAHYTELGFDIYQEGDTFDAIKYMPYTKPDGTPVEIHYYKPEIKDGVVNGCTYNEFKSEIYEENKVYTFPEIDGREYIWGSPGVSWLYDKCEFFTIYSTNYPDGINYGGNGDQNVHYYAMPTLEPKIECDKDELKEGETANCELKVNAEIPVFEFTFKMLSEELDIKDIELQSENFKYDETTKEISYTHTVVSMYLPQVLYNESILKFTVSAKKELYKDIEDNKEKKYTIDLKDIIYEDKRVRDYKPKDKVKEITLKGKEVITTTSKTTTSTTSKKEEVENPKTGVEDYLIILAFILPFAGLTLYYLKDRGLFKGL